MLDPSKVAKNFEAYDKEIGRLHKEIEALEAQIAVKADYNELLGAAYTLIEVLHVDLTKARAQIAALAARHEKALIEGAALLAERNEARAQLAKLEAENKKWVELMERRGELIFGREGD